MLSRNIKLYTLQLLSFDYTYDGKEMGDGSEIRCYKIAFRFIPMSITDRLAIINTWAISR